MELSVNAEIIPFHMPNKKPSLVVTRSDFVKKKSIKVHITVCKL